MPPNGAKKSNRFSIYAPLLLPYGYHLGYGIVMARLKLTLTSCRDIVEMNVLQGYTTYFFLFFLWCCASFFLYRAGTRVVSRCEHYITSRPSF
jgi:hypothetical protein